MHYKYKISVHILQKPNRHICCHCPLWKCGPILTKLRATISADQEPRSIPLPGWYVDKSRRIPITGLPCHLLIKRPRFSCRKSFCNVNNVSSSSVYNLSRWFNNNSFVQELAMISQWLVIFFCPQCPTRFYGSQMWRRQSVSCSRFCNETLVKQASSCNIKFHIKYQISQNTFFHNKNNSVFEYTFSKDIKPL